MRTVDDDGYAQLDLGAVCSRIRELQETISAGVIALETSSRNARVAALQKRWDRLRVGLDHRSFRTSVALTPATLGPSDS